MKCLVRLPRCQRLFVLSAFVTLPSSRFLDATFHSLFFQVKWFRDGSEIRKGKKYEIISKGVQRILIVHKSVFDDEAEYECDARTAKTTGILTVIGESGVHCLCDVCVCLPES